VDVRSPFLSFLSPTKFCPQPTVGWFGGAAVGAKLGLMHAGKPKFVTAVVGDGTFLFSVPSSVYWMSRRYNVPFLTIVLNNSGWHAPRKSAQLVHPAGYTASATNSELNISFDPSPDYVGFLFHPFFFAGKVGVCTYRVLTGELNPIGRNSGGIGWRPDLGRHGQDRGRARPETEGGHRCSRSWTQRRAGLLHRRQRVLDYFSIPSRDFTKRLLAHRASMHIPACEHERKIKRTGRGMLGRSNDDGKNAPRVKT